MNQARVVFPILVVLTLASAVIGIVAMIQLTDDHHWEAVTDFARVATDALNIPLRQLLERSMLLTLQTEAFWRSSGVDITQLDTLRVPINALFQGYGGQGWAGDNAASSIQLETINIGLHTGQYYGVQKVAGAFLGSCIFEKNATAIGECLEATSITGGVCRNVSSTTSASLFAPDCYYDPRYTAVGDWETGNLQHMMHYINYIISVASHAFCY